MAGLTESGKREFAKRVLDILTSNADELKKAGIDVSSRTEELQKKLNEAFDAEQKQLQAQAEAKKATATSVKATTEVYELASSSVELIVGSLGKKAPLSQKLKNLRDQAAKESLRGKKRKQE